MRAAHGNDEFVGYTFQGSPPRRSRLWFLDRHIELLFEAEDWRSTPNTSLPYIDVGRWSGSILRAESDDPSQYRPLVRYEHGGTDHWTATWELTHAVIEHVNTFGRDDDVWRLGLWPD